MKIDRIMLGIRIFTEFQKPTLIPPHSRPVQAVLHACTQASVVHISGKAKILPCRISGMDLNEVTSIT